MKHTFINLLKLELKKAIKNNFFIFILLITSLFALFSAWYNIESYFYEGGFPEKGNPLPYGSSLFTYWIGAETSSLGFTLGHLGNPSE